MRFATVDVHKVERHPGGGDDIPAEETEVADQSLGAHA
jgi:hypothetical protein